MSALILHRTCVARPPRNTRTKLLSAFKVTAESRVRGKRASALAGPYLHVSDPELALHGVTRMDVIPQIYDVTCNPALDRGGEG